MALSCNYYALIAPRLEKIFARTTAPKVPEWPSYGNFFQSQPIPAFSKKVQRGHQRKFFKNRLKSSPRLKGPKGLWRKWQYPLNSMHWKCKDWRRFRRITRLQKCPNGQVIASLARSTKTRIFWKSAKGGRREIFWKIAQKDVLDQKA